MTQTNPFLDVLKQKPLPSNERQPAIGVLEQFCSAIQQSWNGALQCSLRPGYPTNYGQEYRVVIWSKKTGYEHTLLRAYIPINGTPIKLDLYDFSLLECSTLPELETALRQFLEKAENRDAIETFASRA